eukprot:3730366-Amphidinium_carterae.1
METKSARTWPRRRTRCRRTAVLKSKEASAKLRQWLNCSEPCVWPYAHETTRAMFIEHYVEEAQQDAWFNAGHATDSQRMPLEMNESHDGTHRQNFQEDDANSRNASEVDSALNSAYNVLLDILAADDVCPSPDQPTTDGLECIRLASQLERKHPAPIGVGSLSWLLLATLSTRTTRGW